MNLKRVFCVVVLSAGSLVACGPGANGCQSQDPRCDGDVLVTCENDLEVRVTCSAGSCDAAAGVCAIEDCLTPGDEDGDGAADCDDTDCATFVNCLICGNGVIDDGEECDLIDLNGESCIGLGFNTGSLNCAADCTLDTINCSQDLNVAPSFDAIPDQSVADIAGPTTIAIANISSGPAAEFSQQVTITAVSDNPALTGALTVTNNFFEGSITFTPTSGQTGTATITVTAKDDGGTSGGGNDTFSSTFKITVFSPLFVPANPPAVSASFLGGNDLLGQVAVADFNVDGKLDFAVVMRAANRVAIRLGAGNGTFTSAADAVVGLSPVGLALGDFTGGGVPDLVCSNVQADTISVQLGAGDGTFLSAIPPELAGSGRASIAVGDFNGDNKLDFATVNSTSNRVIVRLGVGNGSFTLAPELNVSVNSKEIAAGDFNGDNKLDLIVSGAGGGGVLIFPGVGDGTFGGFVFASTDDFNSDIVVGDFNGDNKLDFGVLAGGVNIRLGVGGNAFTAAPNINIAGVAVSAAVGDFNEDGVLDLAVVDRDQNNLVVQLGVGDGTFTLGDIFVVGAIPESVAAGDFDGDGRLDLAVSSTGTDTVNILLQH